MIKYSSLEKEVQAELVAEGLTTRPVIKGLPSYILEAARRAGKVYDPATNTFKNAS